MTRLTIVFTLILSLCFTFGFAEPKADGDLQGKLLVRQTFMEQSPGKFNLHDYVKKQNDRFNRLMSEAAVLTSDRIISIHVSDMELEEIDNYKCADCGKASSAVYKRRVGLVKPVNFRVDLSGAGFDALHRTPDGGFVWTGAIQSEKAAALRVHFSDIVLPENSELYIYNHDGDAFGPYRTLSGEFWTNTVTGPLAYVQLKFNPGVTPAEIKTSRFTIANIGHLGHKFLLPFLQQGPSLPEEVDRTESFCSYNAACIVDANCYSTSDWGAIEDVKKGVAHMQWISMPWIYICTGGLLNDTVTTSQIPYFLTANHCISSQSDASSLECYWQYWTASCGSACYDPVGVVPRTLGATLLSTNSTGDYTLMQLSENPPAGSVFMGWNTTAIASTSNFQLYRISHPSGAPSAYSRHSVDPASITCSGWPRGSWIYSKDIIGATEGGSSGSPVCNASGQVVGQLSGACGYNVNDPCDSTNNWTADGAFASYYTAVMPWLDPSTPTTTIHVDSITLTKPYISRKYNYTATVVIKDNSGNPISGATVSGTFTVSGRNRTASDVTGVDGTAVLVYVSRRNDDAFSFCVTNVTHSSYIYNSADNVETCDTY